MVRSNSHATGVSNQRSGGPTSFLLRFFAYPPNFAFRPEKKKERLLAGYDAMRVIPGMARTKCNFE